MCSDNSMTVDLKPKICCHSCHCCHCRHSCHRDTDFNQLYCPSYAANSHVRMACNRFSRAWWYSLLGIPLGGNRLVQPGSSRVFSKQKYQFRSDLQCVGERVDQAWKEQRITDLSQRQGVSIQQQTISEQAGRKRHYRKHEQSGLSV